MAEEKEKVAPPENSAKKLSVVIINLVAITAITVLSIRSC